MSELAQHIPVSPTTEALVSISRVPGSNEIDGGPRTEPLAGNVLPRLCHFAGAGACKIACQAPDAYANEAKDCAQTSGRQFFESLGVDIEDVHLGVVTGSTNVAFLDEVDPATITRNAEGIKSFPKTDALFGYSNTVKACRLADCGMLVVSGTDGDGRHFDGFVHATRNNLNGDTQFEDDAGRQVGGVTRMLDQVQDHYRPRSISLRLVAGVMPQNYLWNFTPEPGELAKDPTLTAERKRESMFSGWAEKGWIRPHLVDGVPDGRYEPDMIAAIGHQVAEAGLAEAYTVDVQVNGDPYSGHASNGAGKHGITAEERDYYVVLPTDYPGSGRTPNTRITKLNK